MSYSHGTPDHLNKMVDLGLVSTPAHKRTARIAPGPPSSPFTHMHLREPRGVVMTVDRVDLIRSLCSSRPELAHEFFENVQLGDWLGR